MDDTTTTTTTITITNSNSNDDQNDHYFELSSSPAITMTTTTTNGNSGFPFVQLVEEPNKCGVRFRYECEGRISGAIPGLHSTTLRPTYPTLKLFNHVGRARVVVSCVTKNAPYRAHPHNLVGKKSCKDGVCVQHFDSNLCVFNNLGILCAKRKDIRERLRMRETLRIDPFGTGFGHKSQAFKVLDLAVVRLAFQTYIESIVGSGHFDTPLQPIVSEPIYDKKAMSELSIAKLSHYSACVSGGSEIILLCDRVIKDDIQIRFFEERNECLYWEAFAHFKANDIHKHFAISFRSPKYCDQSITLPVPVNIQLRRPSDGGTSESLPFYLLPKRSERKQQKSERFEYNFEQQYNNNDDDVIEQQQQQCLQQQQSSSSSLLFSTMSDFIDFDLNSSVVDLNANNAFTLWTQNNDDMTTLLDISCAQQWMTSTIRH